MSDLDERLVQERMRLALELSDLGIAIMRENLRRRHPLETDQEIERRLIEWLHTRPGAEFGDAAGHPGSRAIAPTAADGRR